MMPDVSKFSKFVIFEGYKDQMPSTKKNHIDPESLVYEEPSKIQLLKELKQAIEERTFIN